MTVTIDGYDQHGNALVSCTCGARWVRSKVSYRRAPFKHTYTCVDCGARPEQDPADDAGTSAVATQ